MKPKNTETEQMTLPEDSEAKDCKFFHKRECPDCKALLEIIAANSGATVEVKFLKHRS